MKVQIKRKIVFAPIAISKDRNTVPTPSAIENRCRNLFPGRQSGKRFPEIDNQDIMKMKNLHNEKKTNLKIR
jgi:hypothetical protein